MQVVKLTLCLFGSAVTLVATGLSPAWAQVTQTRPLEEFTRPQEAGRDPFTGTGGSGVFDLIHRANLGGLKDNATFQEEQRQNLNNAASDFRARQLELLRSQPSQPAATSTEPTIAPGAN
jgi:hypothetical protein